MVEPTSSINHLPTTIKIERYLDQQQKYWPTSGKALLAQFDEESVIVYLATSQSVADYAVEHQSLSGIDGEFKLKKRSTWVRSSFLYMNQRSWWNTKDSRNVGEENTKQARTLAIRIRRTTFDNWIENAIINELPQYQPLESDASDSENDEIDAEWINDIEKWKEAKLKASVTYKWVPDRLPCLPLDGTKRHQKLPRKVIQFLLKGSMLSWFASTESILSIEDITPFVHEMRDRLIDLDKQYIHSPSHLNQLLKDIWIPSERIYTLKSESSSL
ncbi:unnamed protein product [Cunninghamella blakesleeana]